MRIVFAGTPEFAQHALQHIIAAGYTVPLVLTQPDRPAGRGMQLQASPVKQTALANNIAVEQPRSLRLDGKYPQDAQAAQQALLAARPDVMVVTAYGLLLPQWVLDLPRLGCINIHASLLPRWRGAAPIHRAIEAGDAQTGITIMQMDIGLDTGDMLLQEAMPIAPHDTTATLHDKLAAQGARLTLHALQQLQQGKALPPTPQPQDGITYAEKISKTEALLDWAQPAQVLERRVRAFTPFPVANTTASSGDDSSGKAETIKVRAACLPTHKRPSHAQAGEIIAIDKQGIHVACGTQAADGVLCLQTLQRAGGKALAADAFLRGFALNQGAVLGR